MKKKPILTSNINIIKVVKTVAQMLTTLAISAHVLATDVTLVSNSVPDLITAINNANINAGPDSIDLGGFEFTINAIDNVTTDNNGLPSITDSAGLLIKNGIIGRDLAAPNFRLLHVSSTGLLDKAC